MWKLNSPDTQEAEQELLKGLLRLDGKPVHHKPTASQRNGLKKLYVQYDATRGSPLTKLQGLKFAEAFRDAVKAAYEQVQEGGRLSALRNRLKNVLGHCPYCGIGEIGDLDHFLPQTTYHLLAIYARNLIPCCHKCNRAKGTLDSPTPTEHLAHAYLDSFPQERFFLAEVMVSPAGLKTRFYIQKSPAMTQAFADRLAYQVQRFKLNERYPAAVNIFMAEQKVSIEQAGQGGLPVLRATLHEQRTSLSERFGRNDWRTALMYALAESDDFCNGGYQHCFGAPYAGA